MNGTQIDEHEQRRLSAVHRLNLLDTEPEPSYEHIVDLATRLLKVPIALISLIDEHRQWYKARRGTPAVQTSRELTFCRYAIERGAPTPLVVEDATVDARFAAHPDVTGAAHVRFYASQPLHAADGEVVGTLCIVDVEPRPLSEAHRQVLCDLALLVDDLLARQELRLSVMSMRAAAARDAVVRDTMHDGMTVQDADGRIVEWNPAAERVLGLSGDELAGRTSVDPMWRCVHTDGSPWPGDQHPAMEAIRTGAPVRDVVMGLHRPGSGLIWLRVNSTPTLNDDAMVTGVVNTFADITDVVEAERMLQNLGRAQRVPATPKYDSEELLDVLGRYLESMDAAAAVLANDRHGVEALIREVRSGGSLTEFIGGAPPRSEQTLTSAISKLEEQRRLMRHHLFRSLVADGASIGDVARTWGISRQLASRILNSRPDSVGS